jgi:hypothetical protein
MSRRSGSYFCVLSMKVQTRSLRNISYLMRHILVV